MKKATLFALFMLMVSVFTNGQTDPFENLNVLIGDWTGSGSGFGNETSKIESSFQYVMDGKYIEVVNDSKFEPTTDNPRGEHHVDKGFISHDQERKLIMFRQFNIEGYINQYALNTSVSNDSTLVFETEEIENLSGGKARWTILINSDTKIETVFDVSFSRDEFTCMGINELERK
jgi:hypothetical protein